MSDKIILNKIETYSAYYKHPSYYLEKKLLNALQRGLKPTAFSTLAAINALERAKLADSPIRSTKNSLIASCTLFTRAAIEANVPPEEAFLNSDVHINEIESLGTLAKLQAYEQTMLEAYIDLVHTHKTSTYTRLIVRAIDYIHENITDPLSLNIIAKHLNKSKSYVCSLFKEEVGISMMDYINSHKIEESLYFLNYSNMSISDIAYLFSFCNPGYFTRLFKKYTGKTPQVYIAETTGTRV